jgi:RNA polymerase sigma-70 factor, ECF subfamily
MISVASDSTQLTGFEREALPYLNELFRTARAILKCRNDAEDVVEETYRSALRASHGFTPGTNSRASLFGILFRTISNRRPKWLSPDPSEEVLDEEMLATFRTLPPQFAEVVMLADVQRFSYSEIGEILRIPRETVVSRLSGGRQLLRMQLARETAETGIA